VLENGIPVTRVLPPAEVKDVAACKDLQKFKDATFTGFHYTPIAE
jgi:hypothetical protein